MGNKLHLAQFGNFMKKIFFAFLLLLSVSGFSQSSKTHYIPPLSNSDSQPVQGQFLYISCPSTTDVKFNIKQIGGATVSGVVNRDHPYVLDNIGAGSNTQLMVAKALVGTVQTNKGFIVEAEDLVYVTVRLTSTPGNDQAGGLVSKGLAALGTRFRVGAFTNTKVDNSAPGQGGANSFTDNLYTFASVIASENNTTVNFSVAKPGVTLVNNIPTNSSVVLNQGESYVVAVQGIQYSQVNNDGLIGALITSNKPIAVNCGSFAGTNAPQNLDLGFDQIVSAERTGSEYIFVRGIGPDILEKPIIIADTDNTNVYINGSATPYNTTPLKAGDYVGIDGSQYINGNMYVKTTNTAGVNTNVFAYQCLGGTAPKDDPLYPQNSITGWPNQNMEFVPPLSCQTPKVINNIPYINDVGDPNADSGDLDNFIGTVCVVTEAGATLTFIINGKNYTLTQLPPGVTFNGPTAVTGNSQYVTYNFNGLKGNISVFSTKQVYVSYYGSSGNATYGGFYSGFTFKPEISFGKTDPAATNCIPNIKLSVNSLSNFDTYQWYSNPNASSSGTTLIPGATSNNYNPIQPGFYNVVAKLQACNITMSSDNIPVSVCPPDGDNDGANDNVDIDLDNDGITNCTESLGTQALNLSNPNSGSINNGTYSNTFTGVSTGAGAQAFAPFMGKSDGTFVSEVVAGKTTSVKQTFSFGKPVSLSLEYVAAAATTDLLSSNGDFVLEVPIGNTITVLNPDNQLLIDTNYDGVYENGVTQYSSFQLRFRLNNGGLPLAAGTGTFKFLSRLVSTFSYTHKNLSDTQNNRATFLMSATCLPMDTDGDGVANEIDLDDENDGIPDLVEALGSKYPVTTLVDANGDGLYDAYAPGLGTLDTDKDLISDYLDVDSDNDGIYDLVEAQHSAPDADANGVIDGAPAAFGINGFYNALETPVDSGKMNYTVADTDKDGTQNYISLDSDGDGCFDVIEAGFLDPNSDGYLGNIPVTVNAVGKVTSGVGYTAPNSNYITIAPITITTQPQPQSQCETQNASFTIATSTPVDGYQWQLSIDNGATYTKVLDGNSYAGSTTATLQITNLSTSMNGYKYKVALSRNGNTCGLISAEAVLTVLARPNTAATVTLVQCDDNTDGFTDFNLNQAESQISPDYATETFTYFHSLAGAQNNDPNSKIANPTTYNNSNGNTVWARVVNANNCFNVTQMNLVVSVTTIPATTQYPYGSCDDYIDGVSTDTDGISVFDFSSATAQILTLLPNTVTYNVTYYKTEKDALEETDELGNSLAIPDNSNYRNIGYPGSEVIWVRIDNGIDNACVGLGPYVLLTVNPLPDITLSHDNIICTDGNNTTVEINAGLNSGAESQFSYQWSFGGSEIAGATDYNYTADSEGAYTCVVKNKATGCERTRTENVAYSKLAVIDNIVIVDLVDNNTVTINLVTPGDYNYGLDSETGPFQDSNVITNVEMGFHTVYVNDKHGCGVTTQTIAVVGAPKFFTPNGDSYNDTWKPKGVDNKFNTKTKVEIFDRFGKLLYEISNGNSEGWDGTYNGYPLPADDYWFVISMQDGRVVRGHFSLKR